MAPFPHIIALLLTLCSGVAFGATLQEPVQIGQDLLPSLPLAKTVTGAKLIVVARLVKIVSKPSHHGTSKPASKEATIDAGRYSVDVVFTLKGHFEHRLNISIAETSFFGYNDVPFSVIPGKLLLLFLVPSVHPSVDEGQWAAEDANVPLTPLRSNFDAVTAGSVNTTVLTRIVGILLDTMSDSLLRKANTLLLENMIDPRLPRALIPYLNDANRNTRVSICTALATNQVVEAIPSIVRLEKEMMSGASGRNCIFALQFYKTRAALPLLNPLLFDASEYTRRNAVGALRDIGDKSSIPYLMLALRDPQDDIAYNAYATLNRLLPRLGNLKTTIEFDAHRILLCAPYYAWWRRELLGEHLPGMLTQKSKQETIPKKK